MSTVRPKGRLISFFLLFLYVFQSHADGFHHKGGKGAICVSNGCFHLLNHFIGKTDGFIGAGGGFWNTVGDTKFSHALIHQPFQILPNYCNAGCMKSLHYIVHDMDVMQIRNAKPWDCIAGRGVLIWQ